LITHKLREALAVADEVTVLRHGATTLNRLRADVGEEQLIEAMLGQRQLRDTSAVPNVTPGHPVIVARHVSVADERGSVRVRDASFDVRAGEIVGVAAVEGSGHRELLRALAGRLPISGGTLTLPTAIGFVPSDRHRDGLVLGMSLAENYALKGAGQRRGMLPWREVAWNAREIISAFDVRAADDAVVAGTLSGGNQQKFMLGRELHGLPPALVVENPTRGLDVRAAAFVRNQLLEACANGVAVVAHSSDLEEMVSVASRILVVYSGEVRELPADIDLVGRAMVGAA
jgi:simple sugar transport system ATP-binding protein